MDSIKIRASSLTGYVDCQLRTMLSAMPHIAQEHGHELKPYRPNIGALVGSGVHAAAELGLRQKMLGNIETSSAMMDAGVEAFHARMAEENEAGAGDLVMDEETPSLSVAEQQITRMARQYRFDVVADVVPVSVESRIECDAGDGIILSGQSDVLALVREGEQRVLRDLKTGRRKTSASKHMPQQGAYSLLERSLGHEVDAGQIDHLRRSPLKKAQEQVDSEAYDIVAAEQIATAVLMDFAAKAKRFAQSGDPGHALVNPGSFLCSPKFCRAHGCAVCPATHNK